MKLIHYSFFSFIILLNISFLSSCSDVKTFTCTDITIANNYNSSEQNRVKENALGTKADITFYDNSIRVEIYNNSGKSDFVLDKIDSEHYVKQINNERLEINFETFLGYVYSFKMSFWLKKPNSYSYEFVETMTFERNKFN